MGNKKKNSNKIQSRVGSGGVSQSHSLWLAHSLPSASLLQFHWLYELLILLHALPTSALQTPPFARPTSHKHGSSFACHELWTVNDWSPTFPFLLSFSYISYMVRERTVMSIIWERHPQGKAETRLDNSTVSDQRQCLCIYKSLVYF